MKHAMQYVMFTQIMRKLKISFSMTHLDNKLFLIIIIDKIQLPVFYVIA